MIELRGCHRFVRHVQAIGYDMDYTLAQYKPDTFEGLAHKVMRGRGTGGGLRGRVQSRRPWVQWSCGMVHRAKPCRAGSGKRGAPVAVCNISYRLHAWCLEQETVAKLVDVFRYPEELRQLDFQWDYMTKGLIIDKVGSIAAYGKSAKGRIAAVPYDAGRRLWCALLWAWLGHGEGHVGRSAQMEAGVHRRL